MKDNDEEMRKALAAYTGLVIKCPPGEPRARKPFVKSAAVEWLKEHHDDDAMAQRRLRQRMARARRERTAKLIEHNAPMLEQIAEQERIAQIGKAKR